MNIYLVLSLVARFLTLLLLGFYILPRQIHEVRRVHDGFSRLRLYVLLLIIFFYIASLPVIAYQYTTIYSVGRSSLQNIATLSSGVANLIVGGILYLIYNYKYEE